MSEDVFRKEPSIEFETIPPPPRTPVRWHAWLLASFVLMGLMLFFFYAFPQKNLGPRQPVPFSHRIHAGVKEIDCQFCHPYVERSQRAGIPSMQKCFFCHQYIIPLHPEIQKEREHYDQRDPVRWVRVFNLPDHVQFRHQPHVRWAKLDCTRCHGQVREKDRLQTVTFEMQFCIQCHRQMNSQTDCWLACHH